MAKNKATGTKADAIRTAISALGGPDSAKTADVVAKIKDDGFKASGNEVSMYKTKMRKTLAAPMPRALAGGGDGVGIQPLRKGGKPKVENYPATLIVAVKAMIDEHGADKVKGLANLLGR